MGELLLMDKWVNGEERWERTQVVDMHIHAHYSKDAELYLGGQWSKVIVHIGDRDSLLLL